MSKPISDENFKRIQIHAIPLEDTLDTALARILDFYESNHPIQAGVKPDSRPRPESALERQYDPYEPPNLTHTKITLAMIAGQALRSPNWNSLLDELIKAAAKRMKDFPALRGLIPVNIANSEKSDEGYHFLPEAKISVQGQSANDAWRAIAVLARHLNMSVEVRFFWRMKEGALRPGEAGSFLIERRS